MATRTGLEYPTVTPFGCRTARAATALDGHTWPGPNPFNTRHSRTGNASTPSVTAGTATRTTATPSDIARTFGARSTLTETCPYPLNARGGIAAIRTARGSPWNEAGDSGHKTTGQIWPRWS